MAILEDNTRLGAEVQELRQRLREAERHRGEHEARTGAAAHGSGSGNNGNSGVIIGNGLEVTALREENAALLRELGTMRSAMARRPGEGPRAATTPVSVSVSAGAAAADTTVATAADETLEGITDAAAGEIERNLGSTSWTSSWHTPSTAAQARTPGGTGGKIAARLAAGWDTPSKTSYGAYQLKHAPSRSLPSLM
jgi:hypothetical protein